MNRPVSKYLFFIPSLYKLPTFATPSTLIEPYQLAISLPCQDGQVAKLVPTLIEPYQLAISLAMSRWTSHESCSHPQCCAMMRYHIIALAACCSHAPAFPGGQDALAVIKLCQIRPTAEELQHITASSGCRMKNRRHFNSKQ